MMKIKLNGEPIETSAATFAALFEEQNLDTRGVAVAVGDRVIPRSSWDEATLTEGIDILLIRATQGG